MKSHRAPWQCTYAKEDKSKCKPGKKPKLDQEYFEILSLCILQSGLNWGTVRNNWPKYRKGFYGFHINKLARAQLKKLMKSPYVIKNPKKIKGIIDNAKEFQKIRKEHNSFSSFLNSLKCLRKEEVIKLFVKRFKYVGEYTAEFFPHCVGYW